VAEYKHWDYYVSLINAPEERYSWDQGVKMILEALKPLGEKYVNDIRIGLDPKNGWVDAYAHRAKTSGAYSSNTYGVHPYMLFNFDSEKGLTSDDISTIAHEVGHSMHSYYSEKKQAYPNKDYATFNAEVASTVNETIMSIKQLDDARAAYKKAESTEATAKTKDAKDKAKQAKESARLTLVYLLNKSLDDIRQTFYRQTKFATWEWEAHKMGEKGEPLTKESLSKLYYDLLMEFHGPACDYGDMAGISWMMIPHFYRGYYVYAYATSYAASVALANDIIAEYKGDGSKKGARDRYLAFLASGSSKHPVELLKDAGVDMTTPAPIESLIKYAQSLVDELNKLTK
jgi:oligoendopeptidase F